MSIIVKGLSKKFLINGNTSRIKTLRDSLVNIFSRKKYYDFWALKDLNFSVTTGEIMGVIGLNGSGKSTLLKILSRITSPTEGIVQMKGKVSSLLEVGTGFHPELSGRENIFLNGAMLGMTKKEIEDKFDKIVDFAEMDKFIDVPSKKYSTGMTMRLAFSILAYLETDILLIDEILAVGDIEFQRKSLKRMNDITREKGKTIVFVSHNLTAVQSLCNRCILLDRGKIKKIGSTREVVRDFTTKDESSSLVNLENKSFQIDSRVVMKSLELVDSPDATFSQFWNKKIKFKIKYSLKEKINNIEFAINISSVDGSPLFTVRSTDNNQNFSIKEGEGEISVAINHHLRDGRYIVSLGVSSDNLVYYYNSFVTTLNIIIEPKDGYILKNYGVLNCDAFWQ